MQDGAGCCWEHVACVFGPGLAPTEQWGRWHAAPNEAAWFCRLHAFSGKSVAGWSEEAPLVDKAAYLGVAAGFKGRLRFSLQSAVNAIVPTAIDLGLFLELQRGAAEYRVAAVLLWHKAMEAQGLQRYSVAACSVHLDKWLDADVCALEVVARNAGGLSAQGCKTMTLVARMKTLLGRDLRGHDVADEVAQRTVVGRAHLMRHGGVWSRAAWNRSARANIKKLVQLALADKPVMHQTAEKWWETRALWLPGGTSSQRDTDRLPRAFAAVKGEARTKKVMVANNTGGLRSLLSSRPAIVARAATKNEPGLKRRPLRAADDVSYLVAAFASENLEKWFSIEGSVMRQKPSDVQECVALVSAMPSRRGKIMLCADYSDFNMTHNVLLRAWLNQELSDEYRRRGATAQADAAAWMAKAHLNHTVDGQLVQQGLSSGERDTARDNTLLHLVYYKVAKQALEEEGVVLQDAFTRMCGDDEVMVNVPWYEAMLYIAELKRQNHLIQDRKLLVSHSVAEFLQYNMYADGDMPRQPICPNIINFVSGSWYKTAAYNKTDLPKQVADAAASVWRRGLPLYTARKLAIACCHWLAEGTAWRTRLAATNLFGSQVAPPASVAMPQDFIKQQIGTHTTPAIAEFQHAMCRKLLLDEDELATIRRELETAIYTKPALDLYAGGDIEEFDGMASIDETVMETGISAARRRQLCAQWLTRKAQGHYEEGVWAALQLGMTPALVKKLGVRSLMQRLPNTLRGALASLTVAESRVVVTPLEMASMPGAMADCFMVAPHVCY